MPFGGWNSSRPATRGQALTELPQSTCPSLHKFCAKVRPSVHEGAFPWPVKYRYDMVSLHNHHRRIATKEIRQMKWVLSFVFVVGALIALPLHTVNAKQSNPQPADKQHT